MLKSFIFIFSIFLMFQIELSAKVIDIDNALKKEKPVLIYLHRVGCPYCKEMEKTTLSEEDIIEYLEKDFTYININVTTDKEVIYKKRDITGLAFAKDTGYSFYPSFLFFQDGELVYASVGYQDEVEFSIVLEYIKNKKYKDMSIEKYQKSIDF